MKFFKRIPLVVWIIIITATIALAAAGVGVTTWTAVTTLADGDLFATTDVSNTTDSDDGTSTKLTFLNLKANLKTYFDTLYGSGDGDLLADGTIPLTADWDAGAFDIEAATFTSKKTSGEPGYIELVEGNSTDTSYIGRVGPDSIAESFSYKEPDAQPSGQIKVYSLPSGTGDPKGNKESTITFRYAGASLTPVTDDADNFAANFTGENLYGGTFIANATGTAVLPAIGSGGMNFTIITLGAIAVIIDPNASDSILGDGVQGADGENMTNLSTAGDIAVCQYYSAAGWVCTTNGWTAE